MTAEKIRRIRSNKSPRKDEDRKPWNPNLGDKRGRTFTSQRQYDIYTAYKFLEEEADHIKRCGQPLIPFPKIRERTAALLKCGVVSVTKYVKMGEAGIPFKTPGRVRTRKRKYRDVSNDVKEQIRKLIYDACDKSKFSILNLYSIIFE
ncbi:uncharacterized protein LOC123263570 isoform X1 [Cotesia glomerata]|uniref:uncharacterized protein LOC123263570 isoform X1 n=1 Tax=Cotesia glomerata TaxID=32391 RepID=UPI001D006266|nr:uncharacterized protein LOC123263570 isoform X1 [Cotesia glomerata]